MKNFVHMICADVALFVVEIALRIARAANATASRWNKTAQKHIDQIEE